MDDTSSLRGTKRTRIACSACKQKKQRCDGMRPACGYCVKAGRECTIVDPASKRQVPVNYIEILESRVAQLERLLSNSHPEITMDHLDCGSEQAQPDADQVAVSDSNQNSTIRSEIEPEVEGQHETDGEDDLARAQVINSDLDTLCMGSATGQLLYFGETSALSLSRTLSSVLRGVRLQGPGMTMSGVRSNFWHGLPKPIPASLPEQILGTMLVDAYFTHVHPQYPFLHRPSFNLWENEVHMANETGSIQEPRQLFFVFLVYAIGALIVPGLSPSSSESLYAAAELHLDKVLETESLESIQALLCCAMYSMQATTGVSVWTLSGIALRQCTDLGLHRSKSGVDLEANALESQIQRRVFWVAYNLDRIAAISTGRPFGIAEDDIDVEYPADIDDEHITESHRFLKDPRTHHTEPPTTMSLAIHNLRLRRIWGSIKSRIYKINQDPSSFDFQAIGELKEQLNSWLATCPQPIASDYSNSAPYGSTEWFLLTYHHSIILLHRQALVTHARQGFVETPEMASIYRECAQSARSLCDLYQELYLGSTISHTWGALHIHFLAGLTFIYCLWVDPNCRRLYRRDVVATTCTSCVVVLVIMTERWPAAQPFRDVFRMLANATQTMLAHCEEEGCNRNASVLPAVTANDHASMASQMRNLSSIGMCDTTEHILGAMIQ